MAHKCINQKYKSGWLSCDQKKPIIIDLSMVINPLSLTKENRHCPSSHGYTVSHLIPLFFHPSYSDDYIMICYCPTVFFSQDPNIFVLPFFHLNFLAKMLVSFCSLHILQKPHFLSNKALGSYSNFKCNHICVYKSKHSRSSCFPELSASFITA